VLISPKPDQEGNKLFFLSEWREFPSAPCLAGKKNSWQLASRCCWNRARTWLASELVSFLVGLRIYQHPCKCSARSANHCYYGKAINVTYSESVVVSLGIQHAIRMRYVLWPSVSCPALPHFPHCVRNCKSSEKVIKWKVCVFSTTICHYKKNWARYSNCCLVLIVVGWPFVLL